jgi:PAS domain S-box-containing protein
VTVDDSLPGDLYDHAPCGFHSLDREGRFLAINDTELAWLGYRREDLVGQRHFSDLLTPASRQVFAEQFPRFRERGWIRNLEFEVVTNHGTTIVLLISATAVYDANREYVASRSVAVDITDRKQAEHDRDRFFSLALDMLCISSDDGYFKRLNPAFTRVLGWELVELLARPYTDFVHPDDLEATLREVERQTRAGQAVLRFENRYRHKDGSWRWLSWASVPQPGGLMYATARDVTDLRASEMALRRSEQNLAVTLDSIADAVLSTDTAGRVTRLNPVAERLTGWSQADAIGQPVAEVFRIVNEDTREPAVVPVDAVLSTGTIQGLANHTTLIARDGRDTPIADSAAPIRDAAGEVIGVVLVFRDVTAERDAAVKADALLKDLNDIRAALDAHSIVTQTDPRGRITAANERFTAAFGYTRDELIGQDHRILNAGYHPKEFFRDLWDTITAGRIWRGEIRNRAKDGRLGWFDTTIVPFVRLDGTPSQFVSIQTDITERRQAEADIRRFNTELEALVVSRAAELQREKVFSDAIIESVPGLFYVLDPQGHFLRWNQALQDLVGVPFDQMHQLDAMSFVHGADQDVATSRLAEALSTGYAEAEVRVEAQRGTRHALLTARRLVLDGTTYIVGAGLDITDRKVMEAALVERDRFARASLDALSAQVAVLDEDGVILATNRAWRLFAEQNGIAPALVSEGVNYLAVCDRARGAMADEAPDMARGIRAVISGASDTFLAQYACHSPSEQRWFLCRVTRFPGDGPVCVAVAHENITDIKQSEMARAAAQEAILALNADLERRIADRTEQLELAREAADAANRAKSAFLANMSHEIRTPLNAIAGMVELLDLVTDRTERARMLRVTQESARALAGIIDDVLDFSKIEAGALDVHVEPISLRDVVRSAVDVFASSASAKNLYLRCTVDDRLPPAVLCDGLRLKQILFNLLGNAVKFTAEGGIDLHATLVTRDDQRAVVRVSTTDTGIGIDPEARARIFQPFVQAEANTTRRFGGTGLGLAISQRLAALLGGILTLDSEPGRGTTVTLLLTLVLADPARLPAPSPRQSDAMPILVPRGGPHVRRLLIVDDSTINRDVLHRQLSALGYDADQAVDGRQAFDLWRAGDYALVLADCHMPDMDGYELARSIRSHEAATGRRRTPILGYTANAGKDSRALCTAAGMDDALIKPVPLHTLGSTIATWLSPGPTAALAAAQGDEGPVDWSQLREITGGDEAFAWEVLRAFVAQKTGEVAQLTALLGGGDLTAAAALAHRLKGAARSVAARPLATCLEETERAARDGDRAITPILAPRLEAELARLADAVDRPEPPRHA